jgi:hypothetical protein
MADCGVHQGAEDRLHTVPVPMREGVKMMYEEEEVPAACPTS